MRAQLARDHHEPVIGHCDWETQNFSWRSGDIAVVYDWDSVGIRTERGLAGAAAAVFPSTAGGPVAADLDQTDAFLQAHRLRRCHWDDDAT